MSARNITMKRGEKLSITCGKGKKSRSRMEHSDHTVTLKPNSRANFAPLQGSKFEEDDVVKMMSSSSALKRPSSSDKYSDLNELQDFKKNTGKRFHVVTHAEWEAEKKEIQEKKEKEKKKNRRGGKKTRRKKRKKKRKKRKKIKSRRKKKKIKKKK